MKYTKELTVAIAVIVVTIGRQARLHDFKESIPNKVNIQKEEIKERNLNKKFNIENTDYTEWTEFREKERKNGGKLYCMEDLTPELKKPEEWGNFFLLKELPSDFYLVDDLVEKDDGWTITYCFEDKREKENKLYFIQSNNNNLEEKDFLCGRKMEKNKYYIGTLRGYNIICWIENDITIYLKTNMSPDILEDMIEKVVSYYDVELNYEF